MSLNETGSGMGSEKQSKQSPEDVRKCFIDLTLNVAIQPILFKLNEIEVFIRSPSVRRSMLNTHVSEPLLPQENIYFNSEIQKMQKSPMNETNFYFFFIILLFSLDLRWSHRIK